MPTRALCIGQACTRTARAHTVALGAQRRCRSSSSAMSRIKRWFQLSHAGFGDKFKVKRQKPADSDERETLHYARSVIRPGDRILYIHSKGVSDARYASGCGDASCGVRGNPSSKSAAGYYAWNAS